METYSIYNISKGERKKTKMKGKKFLAFSLTVAMLAGSALTVSAAGVADVFNAGYYADKYGDLKAAYGADEAALLKHFMTSGAKEGRVMSPILDVAAYRKAYADLNAAFGDDWDAYVDHYLTYGIKEKRTTGVLFNLEDYAAKNPDVKAAYGDDYVKIAQHYVNFGIKEGRPGGTMEKPAAVSVSSGSNNGGGSTGNTDNSGSNGATTEKPGTVTPAAHVHWTAAEGAVIIDAVAHTCTKDGYTKLQCKAPVMENVYDPETGNWLRTRQKYVDFTDDNGQFVRAVAGDLVIGNKVYKGCNDYISGKPVTCDAIYTIVDKAAHKAPDGTANLYTEHPTCTATGLIAYTCTDCGKHVTEVVEKLQHDFVKTQVYVESKSCKPGDEGYDVWECKNCHIKDNRPRALLNHKLAGKPNVKVAATCTSTGIAYGYCDWCGREVEETIPMSDHVAATHGANNEWFDVYVDTYTIEKADAHDTTRTHEHYQVRYCKNCNVVLEVSTLIGADPCSDNNVQADGSKGDGACDICRLPMNRTGKNQINYYQVGQKFYGTVQ